jgi:signal transduction histidine kinase
MIIRNADRPEGILISVQGRPLDVGPGQRGAVAVFRDITALREHENDLAAFAGVVAHDLKSPLTAVGAYAEVAVDAIDKAEPGEARQALRRIEGGVQRMRRLIDDLLAYTTARDAAVRPATVNLRKVVADVIAERTDHLPTPELRPDVYVGPLPYVEADPAMIRHVVDNLVGNALKYVQPGQRPRVDISATTGADGWVDIEIADRGIGIPDEHKQHIFDTFHRAHAGAGYTGTGLGLAISRRIIDRHGGTIAVADNPGGGTRFRFTLPYADLPAPCGTSKELIAV